MSVSQAQSKDGAEAASIGARLALVLEGSWRPAPPPVRISVPELEQVVPALQATKTAPLAWGRVRDSVERAEDPLNALRQAYRMAAVKAALHAQQLEQVISLFQAEGIDPIVIKGWATARLYADPAFRPYTDLDLVIRPQEYKRAGKVLSRPELTGIHVDLAHAEFNGLNEAGWSDLDAHGRRIPLGGIQVRVLGPEDELRVMCEHFIRHGARRTLNPLWLCDIAAAVEAAPSGFGWDRCLGHGRTPRWVRCAVGLAAEVLGARVAGTPLADAGKRLPRWLVPALLRQWGKTWAQGWREPPELLLAAVQSPRRIWRGLVARWPDPIQATIHLGAPFNEWPREPIQLADYFLIAGQYVVRLPQTIRERRDPRLWEEAHARPR